MTLPKGSSDWGDIQKTALPSSMFVHSLTCPFHALIKPFSSHFFYSSAVLHPFMCACEGRCLPAGCQVTSLIERSPERCCYKNLNPLLSLILSPFLLHLSFLFKFFQLTVVYLETLIRHFVPSTVRVSSPLHSFRKSHTVLISVFLRIFQFLVLGLCWE